MPGVKCLHQESDSNSKVEYIMGHSCQAVCLLVGVLQTAFAVPLACRIHEGVVFSNRSRATLLDKMLALLEHISLPSFYFVADVYYAASKVIHGLLENGNHLISRVKSNAIAYYPAELIKKLGRGRPLKYGCKIKLKTLFNSPAWIQPISATRLL